MSSRAPQPPPPGQLDELDDVDDDRDVHARSEHDVRSSLERILPELIRKGLEVGRGPLERVSESIFPKEIAASLVGQLGDVRSGIVKAVAQEVNRFLREADIASEIRKVLSGLDVEAHVKLRFKARDGKLDVEIGDDDETRKRKR
jgi:hypothetical protein